jgi:predicted nucleic acid-binding protein
MVTLDASLVIAHLNPHEPHHDVVTAYLQTVKDRGFVMHPINLAAVLTGGVRTGRGQEMLTDLQNIGVREADLPAGQPLRLATLRATTGLKIPACCALETALATTSPLATVDERLAKAARDHRVAVVPTAEPGDQAVSEAAEDDTGS